MPRQAVKVMPEPITVDGVTFTFRRNYCRQGQKRCNEEGWKFKDLYSREPLVLICGNHATFPFDVDAFLAHPRVNKFIDRSVYERAWEANFPTYEVMVGKTICQREMYGLDHILADCMRGYPDLEPGEELVITVKRAKQELVEEPPVPMGWRPPYYNKRYRRW